MTARWLTEPDRQTELAWFFDAPWEAASERKAHQHILAAGGIDRAYYSRRDLAAPPYKDVLRQVIYGNPSIQETPTEMTGLAVHYSTRDRNKACNAINVLDGGGHERVCSAYLVGWGPRTVFMVSADGNPPNIGSECCVVVMDWRFVVRIANLDFSATRPPDVMDLMDLMAKAIRHMPRHGPSEWVRPIFYINKDTAKQLRANLKDRGAEMPEGADLNRFGLIPIRVIDELRSDEARV